MEEEQQRLRELIQQRKAQAALDAENEEIAREKKRREEGKQLQETAKQLEQLKKEREMQQEEKERRQELEYQKKLKEQIQREREERIAKSNLSTSGTLVKDTTSTTSPSSPKTGSTISVLRVRLLDGSTVDEEFNISITLADVIKTLNEKHKITEAYYFRMTFPTKSFSKEDESQTLQQLNLVPNATLIMTPREANRQLRVPSANNISSTTSMIQGLWNYIVSFVYWFIGATPTPPPPQTESQSAFGPRGKVNVINSVGEYEKLKSSAGLVVVDITATWCGPCKRIAPVFDKLAREYPSVLFLKVDLDQFKHTLSDLSGVKSVPTFLFFKNKRLIHTCRGASETALTDAVKQYK